MSFFHPYTPTPISTRVTNSYSVSSKRWLLRSCWENTSHQSWHTLLAYYFPTITHTFLLIQLRKLSEETGCNILAKAEFMNPGIHFPPCFPSFTHLFPGGSVKDRAAYYIIKVRSFFIRDPLSDLPLCRMLRIKDFSNQEVLLWVGGTLAHTHMPTHTPHTPHIRHKYSTHIHICAHTHLVRHTRTEGTAGNTGIGMAHVCNSKGYKLVIYMPDNQSKGFLPFSSISCFLLSRALSSLLVPSLSIPSLSSLTRSTAHSEKIDLLKALGAEVRAVPVAPYTNPAMYQHQVHRHT